MNLFAKQLKELRLQNNYSMQKLAELANVSKSMISKIERDEVQPTLDVATRLAQAFGKSLSSMLDSVAQTSVIKLRREEQSVWEDPVTHLQRRVLSPPFPDGKIEWLEVTIPPLSKIRLGPLAKGSEKYLLVITGRLIVEVSEQLVELNAGDSCYFLAHFPHSLMNPTQENANYFLIIKHGVITPNPGSASGPTAFF